MGLAAALGMEDSSASRKRLGIVLGVAAEEGPETVRLRVGCWARRAPATDGAHDDPTLARIVNRRPRPLVGFSLAEFARVGNFSDDAARALLRYPELLVGRIVELALEDGGQLERVRIDVDPYDRRLVSD